MKYLKTYKLFEDIFEDQSDIPYELWDDISDILIELDHEGFVTSKHFDDVKKVSNKLCEDVIEIVVNKQSTEDFSYDEVEDVFKRLINYLTPYGWNYSILFFPPIGKYHFIEFECGGKDPLAQAYSPVFNNDTEKMLYKSQLEKTLKECHAFKIVFYQNIDHIIKENKSNKDEYHDLMMVLNDLFDDWGITSHSTERFGDDNDDYPEHRFWAFRNSGDQDIMTKNVDSLEDVKDIVIYNIPTEHKDRFWNELMSYKEQIEEVTGKSFHVHEEEVNNLFYDYILRLI